MGAGLQPPGGELYLRPAPIGALGIYDGHRFTTPSPTQMTKEHTQACGDMGDRPALGGRFTRNCAELGRSGRTPWRRCYFDRQLSLGTASPHHGRVCAHDSSRH